MIRRLLTRRRPATAAAWFAARRGATNARLERQFRAWLAADPSHREDYALCEIAWEVSAVAAQEMPQPRRELHAAGTLRRRAVPVLLAAALVGIAVSFWPAPSQTWSTGAGEQRTLVLEDGSRMMLNTRTRVEVRFARRERAVRLLYGEAFFEVAKDGTRPFTVRTPLGSARAVGTRFNVYLDARRLAVTTEEGRVVVDSTTAGNGVLVDAGRRAELRSGMARALVEPVNVGAALNWRAQRIEIDNESLEDVLRDFSRYTLLPVRAETPAIGALRVSAVLRTGDVEALAATLRGAFGLRIERRNDALVVSAPPNDDALPR